MGAYNAAEWLLDRNVEEGRGDSVAMRCAGRSITYQDVLDDVWRVQAELERLAVSAGDRVLLVQNDSPALVAWFLGCLRSGVIAVPVSTMSTASDLAAIAADAEASILVLSDEYSGHADTITRAADSIRAVLNDSAELDDHGQRPVARTTRDSDAFWLYSSGTTGVPKGVMHRHGSPQATYDTYATNVLAIGPDDRCLSVAKLFFAYGLGNSLTFPFGAGACAILEPRRPTPPSMIELVRAERPTLFFASPGFVAGVLDTDAPADAFASVRATVTAGESLPAALHQRFTERFGIPVLDGIGTTEALHIFISNTVDDQRGGTSGRVVPGYEIRLTDDDGADVTAAETPGYLHVRGPSIATGYWHREEATAAAFRDGWLRTGDVYTRSEDDHWTFLGRNSDMIKAGGIWVSPAEVESVLVGHPDVLEAAVVGTRNRDGLEEVAAFVVPRAGRTIDAGSIDAHCREYMAAFKRPRRVLTVDELPKTATGKIRRFALRDSLTAET